MPLHDWSKVPSGLFHDFHVSWSICIKNALNGGALPPGFSAYVEQHSGPVESDVLALDHRPYGSRNAYGSVGLAVAPLARFVRKSEKEIFAKRANRIAIKHNLGRTVAVIEIVSPGNKDSRAAFEDFVGKAIEFLRKGIHLLVVDPFPPSKRDPFGIHKAIWDMIEEEDFELPPGQDRIFVSYVAGPEKMAYIEPVGVGEQLPDMPIFLTEWSHILVPLGPTYDEAWRLSPEPLRTAVETGRLPTFDDD